MNIKAEYGRSGEAGGFQTQCAAAASSAVDPGQWPGKTDGASAAAATSVGRPINRPLRPVSQLSRMNGTAATPGYFTEPPPAPLSRLFRAPPCRNAVGLCAKMVGTAQRLDTNVAGDLELHSRFNILPKRIAHSIMMMILYNVLDGRRVFCHTF